MGQLKAPDAEMPVFAACKRLDYETELRLRGAGNSARNNRSSGKS